MERDRILDLFQLSSIIKMLLSKIHFLRANDTGGSGKYWQGKGYQLNRIYFLGEDFAAFALTESGSGSDAGSIKVGSSFLSEPPPTCERPLSSSVFFII